MPRPSLSRSAVLRFVKSRWPDHPDVADGLDRLATIILVKAGSRKQRLSGNAHWQSAKRPWVLSTPRSPRSLPDLATATSIKAACGRRDASQAALAIREKALGPITSMLQLASMV